MKTLYYACRKNGIHGFLKLADHDAAEIGDPNLVYGPEIHFRTQMKLRDAVSRAFGGGFDPQGKPLRLVMKDKPRRADILNLVEIRCGEEKGLQALWQDLIHHAKEIDKRKNLMDGYDLNCHMLTFELLESVGLPAPRQDYEAYVTSHKAQNKAKAAPLTQDLIPIPEA